jgi:hypothetical protein
MEFQLIYAGELFATNGNSERVANRTHHIHAIRREFHAQLKELWTHAPNLLERQAGGFVERMVGDGFTWQPLATEYNNLICKLDVLMLRPARPGNVLSDIDNRLKTLFDALRRAKNPRNWAANQTLVRSVPKMEKCLSTCY